MPLAFAFMQKYSIQVKKTETFFLKNLSSYTQKIRPIKNVSLHKLCDQELLRENCYKNQLFVIKSVAFCTRLCNTLFKLIHRCCGIKNDAPHSTQFMLVLFANVPYLCGSILKHPYRILCEVCQQHNVWFILCVHAFARSKSLLFLLIFFSVFFINSLLIFLQRCRHISANVFDLTLIHENCTPETNLAKRHTYSDIDKANKDSATIS